MRILSLQITALLLALLSAVAVFAAEPPGKLPVAALVGSWHKNSHADVVIGRIPKTYSLDGRGAESRLRLASLYIDSPHGADFSGQLAAEYEIRLCKSIEEALTLGTGKLAVEGVVLCTIHGDYPLSPLGQTLYPHRRMFDAVVKVFADSGRVVPVFIDMHLAANWEDSQYIYETAKRMRIPLMAGSPVPLVWRQPAADVHADMPLKEIIGLSYHKLDLYGFHGLEMIQALAERRQGGETGVVFVQCLQGQAVWDAAGTAYNPELLAEVLARHDPPLTLDAARQKAKTPVLFLVQYTDGLRAGLFILSGAVREWVAGWEYDDGAKASCLFALDKSTAYMHFAPQIQGVETMYLTGHAAWPVERTLLVNGILDAALISKAENGREVSIPEMRHLGYPAFWRWAQPPPPPTPPGK